MPKTSEKTKGKKTTKNVLVENEREKQAENLLRLVDAMHREKNISKDVIFNSMERALHLALQRSSLEEEDILVFIDRTTGEIIAQRGDKQIAPEELGRISAQAAKQAMIQGIREAESEGVFSEFAAKKGELITGTIQRIDAGTAIVSISKEGKTAGGGSIEALLPRSEQIPGETHHVNERVKAVVMEVRRQGHRVKIVLSRCHPDFVKSLFEQEIPEIADRTIEIKSVAREAGYRSKVAVSSIDLKVDCVGACVGVRGSRIKNVIDEINGERIDIVRWNDSMQVMIPNALQPAEISEVMLYPRLGRAIVLVTDDQLSLAIGRRGQNVRLASKLVGWDIEIMTHEELDEGIQKAEYWFSSIPGAPPELAETLITEGFLSYMDLTFIEAVTLVEMLALTGVELTEEQADEIILYAEDMAEKVDEDEPIPELQAAAAAAAAAEEAAAIAVAEGEGDVETIVGEEEAVLEEPAVETSTGGLESLFRSDSDEEATTAEEAVVELVETTEETAPTEEVPTETDVTNSEENLSSEEEKS